jgi:predicted amidophosphoribosyltransferase
MPPEYEQHPLRPRPYAASDIERRATNNFEQIVFHLESSGAHCLRDGSGEPCVVLGSERIVLDWERHNFGLARLLNQVVGIGTLTMEARLTIQRLQIWANERAKAVSFRRFAAMYDDRLYLPLSNGRLLLVSRDGPIEAENGTNADGVWVEHPYGVPLEAFDPMTPVNALPGLDLFERLLVKTQACSDSARWLVAMHEGLLPYVRDSLAARFILVHLGVSQSGKTTGAERFLALHGLGHIKGDYTHAAIGDTGDIGLLVLDNREHEDFNRPLVNFLLFAATGGERGRSNPDGLLRTQSSRPVLVITSIEGVVKQELWNRCVSIIYNRPPGACLDRERIENEISAQRHTINRALMAVLQGYFSIRGSHLVSVPPIPEFLNHFQALCDLLRAYGLVARKPSVWAAGIISEWSEMLHTRLKRSDNEDPLERHILRIAVEDRLAVQPRDLVWNGAPGKLLVTRASSLLVALEELGVRGLPETAAALARRLSSRSFTEITVLDEGRAPAIPELRRRAEGRALGIFISTETLNEIGYSSEQSVSRDHVLTPLEGPMLAEHTYLEASDECYFLWEYYAGLADDPTTRLIRDFKLKPGMKTSHKAAAMHHAAAALSAVIPATWRSQALFVPLPPSKSAGHPEYDGRLLKLLHWVQPGLTNVRGILQTRTDSPAFQKGISPVERAANMMVTSEARTLQPEILILVDDVVTSGAHFKAASLVLNRTYRPRKIIGLFLARTARSASRFSVGSASSA